VRPNILDPKELIPPPPGISLERPVLSRTQMEILERLCESHSSLGIRATVIDCSFPCDAGPDGLGQALDRIEREGVARVRNGDAILVLTHRYVSAERPAVPSLLAIRAVVSALNRCGARLRASIVVEAGDIRSTHEVACAIGFGATAVGP